MAFKESRSYFYVSGWDFIPSDPTFYPILSSHLRAGIKEPSLPRLPLFSSPLDVNRCLSQDVVALVLVYTYPFLNLSHCVDSSLQKCGAFESIVIETADWLPNEQ